MGTPWSQSPSSETVAIPIALTDSQREAIEETIASLTLEAKIGQLMQIDWRVFQSSECAPCIPIPGNWPIKHSDGAVRAAITSAAIGSVLGGGGAAPSPNTPAAWRTQSAELQRAAKLPLLIGNDTVHGQVNLQHATLFPHHIGQGCMRTASGEPDEDLVEALASLAAKESYACGINWAFSPCVTVPHDLRWGRTYEGFGEDADLVGRLGAAEIRGLQAASGVPMAACLKHWAGDGGTINGTGSANFGWTGAPTNVLDQGDTQCSDEVLQSEHISAYLPGLREGALTVMISYSSLKGHPCHASHTLITEILKERLGFDGCVISDYEAIDMLKKPTTVSGPVATDLVDACAIALNAGVDMIMTPAGLYNGPSLSEHIAAVTEAVTKRKTVPMSRIDDAVRRILRVKHAIGLFSATVADPASYESCVGCEAHRSLSRKAVSQSCVLLVNKNGVLPLTSPSSSTGIYVLGRGANHLGMQCGGWSMEWQGIPDGTKRFTTGTTIWEGIQTRCKTAKLLTDNTDAAAWIQLDGGTSPVAIVVTGEGPYAEGGGDTKDLTLPDADVELIASLKRVNVRVVLCLLSGRPLVIPPETLEQCDAFVACWLPGTEGDGVADVLFGDAPFTGRLSFSWPKTNAQATLGARSGTRTRGQVPLFPLGFGV